MALSWVIGTLSLAVVELSVLQGEREHVLRQERDSESEMWRAWCPEQAGRAEAEHGTHDVGALGLEGIGATHIQVGCVIGLQEADEVETLRLGKKMDSGKEWEWGPRPALYQREPRALGKVCAMKPHQEEALVPCPLSLACPLAPTWLLLPFWMHSDFFSKGASHEIWGQGEVMSAMS